MKNLKNVFEVIDFPAELKQSTIEWLNDLSRTAIFYTVCRDEAYHGSALDQYLLDNGADNQEEVVLFLDW